MYRKSHGAIGPGEQTSRGYDWHGADMSKKIFGMKGNSLAYNGVSVNVAEALKGGCDSDQASSITLKRVGSLSDTSLNTLVISLLFLQLHLISIAMLYNSLITSSPEIVAEALSHELISLILMYSYR